MKCTIPEISWHNRDPVLSVDIQKSMSNNNTYRMASGGTDSHVLIWKMFLLESGAIQLDCVCDLVRHQKAVNVVRFSPSGEFLASGDDESTIIIWRPKTDQDLLPEASKKQDFTPTEYWVQVKVLRGHLNDVYDLCWSPNSAYLISGSVDNSAILWDVHKGKKLNIFDDHKNFVQGVTWDPQNKYFVTLSSDGNCRVYSVETKRIVQRIARGRIPGRPGTKTYRLFHDDTLKSFFRRLTFSPDGKLLITPSGIIESEDAKSKYGNAVWVFSRYNFSNPIMYYPTLKESPMVVKACPVLFTLRPDQDPVVLLPYRMVIAISTKSLIFVYDTQQAVPIGVISNIHYTKLTDLTWSSDGLILLASSTDGYCSIVTFTPGELGDPYVPDQSKKSTVQE